MSMRLRRCGLVFPGAVLGLLLTDIGLRAEEPEAAREKAPTPEEYARAFRRAREFLFQPLQSYREALARKQAAENLRQLAFRLPQFQDTLPPQQPGTWALQLLPYIEQENLYRAMPLNPYLCPSDTGRGNRFGARIEPVPPVLASQLALPKDQGQVIGAVEKGKAADKAGLRQHDILLKLNGKDVPGNADAFAKLLAEIKPGKAVDAVVLREGKRLDVKELSLPEGSIASPQGMNYAYADGSVRWLTPNTTKWITDGTSNTLMIGEAWWGASPRDGWKVWSKGDPILATTFRSKERFTTRHQEGSLVLTIVGTVKEGKPTASGITVREGNEEKKYDALDKVPAEYRDKTAQLIELSAK